MTRRNHPEDTLHIAVASYLHVALPHGWVWSTVDMGGKRSKVEAARLKAKGARKGYPDIEIIAPVGTPNIYLELKAPGKYATKEQKEFAHDVRALGHQWHLCRSLNDVEFALKQAGVETRAKVAA